MTALERLALPILHRIDAERAHDLAHMALLAGFGPSGGPVDLPRLHTNLAGLDLPNPVGLAAGFDKSATLLEPLSKVGFGFLEVGAATPRRQTGNPKPRLFRLRRDKAVINRFGFNNSGMSVIARRLQDRPRGMTIGLNLGANKDSTDRPADYVSVLETCGPQIDFATVNVSSPNTEKLRDLQGKAALTGLLRAVMGARAGLARPIPVFLKIAPDLSPAELEDVADVVLDTGMDGIIATNTTLDRDGLKDANAQQAGGLSGAPLFEKSTRILAQLWRLTDGRVPLIGVGGIASPQDAFAKIAAGASAVQLYTGLVYGGLTLAADVARGLDTLLAQNGFDTVAAAVGHRNGDWT